MPRATCLIRQVAITRVIKGALAAGLMHFTLSATPAGVVLLTYPPLPSPSAISPVTTDDDDDAAAVSEDEASLLREIAQRSAARTATIREVA